MAAYSDLNALALNRTFKPTGELSHTEGLIKDASGITAHGKQHAEWDAGCRFDLANPDYR